MDTTAAGLGLNPFGAAPLPPAEVALGASALAASGLTRRFANGRGVFDVDLHVRRGEFVALTGPSGAGKTTLLRLLAGIERPDRGAVVADGRQRTGARRGDTSIALVFQRPRLVGRATSAENVLAGRLGHLPRWRALLKRFGADDWQLALQSLDQVGLLEHAADRADRLSGGEQQRVAIARALAQQPRVLLADEPVSSLDPDNARRVLTILRACADRGLAVVASLHQPELAREFSDRCVAMAAGRFVKGDAALV
jgi:phosphonate transport system ATP-binding protein